MQSAGKMIPIPHYPSSTFEALHSQHCVQSERWFLPLNTKPACVEVSTLLICTPFPFPDGLTLEWYMELEVTTMLCTFKVGHWCLLAVASGCICLSVRIVVDIRLWNVGFHLADLISRTSGSCWEELLPPQSRTGAFSVLPEVGEDFTMTLC